MNSLKSDIWKAIMDESNEHDWCWLRKAFIPIHSLVIAYNIRFSDNLTMFTCFAFVVYTLDLVQRIMR